MPIPRLVRLRAGLLGRSHTTIEDPIVEDLEPGAGVAVRKLFQTSVGAILVEGSAVTSQITRFDDAGWAARCVWTIQSGTAALVEAIVRAGVPATEASRLAEELEPLIAGRRLMRHPGRGTT